MHFLWNPTGIPVPPHLQVLITRRYLATGNHQLTVSDCYDVSQPSVSRFCSRVTRAIARMSHDVIRIPTPNDTVKVMEDFMLIAGMPGVCGCIDCTHIIIKRPSGDRTEAFRNWKGTFSLNVQAICGPQLQFYNVVARWPIAATTATYLTTAVSVSKWRMESTEVITSVMLVILVGSIFWHYWAILVTVRKNDTTGHTQQLEIALNEPLES